MEFMQDLQLHLRIQSAQMDCRLRLRAAVNGNDDVRLAGDLHGAGFVKAGAGNMQGEIPGGFDAFEGVK